ncbi:MAG TPA: ADOP family duplicated permease, partial [Myxococcaceae bacterium]|nr:ADOP family duplicated permease [Myxococcaceae bacterium]
LALGVNTGLFSALHGVLLRDLPFAGADRVGSVVEGASSDARTSPVLSGGDLADLPGSVRAFSEVAGWRSHAFNAGPAGSPVRLPGAVASTRFFRVFPAQVLAGRTFDPDLPVGTREAVLSERLWRRMFASDPGVVGRTLMLNGEPAAVVGVVAPDFAVPPEAEVWITPRFRVPDHPLRPLQDQSGEYGSNFVEVAGRLAPGATFAAAQAELDAFSRRRLELHPGTSGPDTRLRVVLFREGLVGSVRPTLLLLSAAALFTLVLACANVAALLLARAMRRRHVLAIRVALGASRLQLFRMACLEGLLLALGGAVLGTALSRAMPPLLLQLWPHQLTTEMLRPSAAILGFTALLALGTTLAISVAPVLGPPGDASVLRAQDASTSGGRRARGARELLVAVQIALTLVLLTSAGLLVRSLAQLQRVAPGFEPAGVVTGSLWVPQVRYPDWERQRAFYRTVLVALAGRPEVSDAAFASRIPLAGGNSGRTFFVPGQVEAVNVDYRLVTGDYFRTLRIPLRSGRTFLESDEHPGAGVAVVNEEFVRRFLGGRDPIGQTVRLTDGEGNVGIVGVVGDIRFRGLDQPPRPELYVPLGSESWPLLNVVVRGAASPALLQTAVRDAVRVADPEQAFGRLAPMEDLLDKSLADRTQAMQLLSLVAALALVLAVTGIYGVVTHAVAQRTRELGIRMALGATAARILHELVLGAMRPVGLGLLAGLLATAAVVPLLRGFLFGVTPHDPLTLLLCGGGLSLVAIAANALAARRSSRASPALALQSE